MALLKLVLNGGVCFYTEVITKKNAGCWKYEIKLKMLETFSSSDIICARETELTFQVQDPLLEPGKFSVIVKVGEGE